MFSPDGSNLEAVLLNRCALLDDHARHPGAVKRGHAHRVALKSRLAVFPVHFITGDKYSRVVSTHIAIGIDLVDALLHLEREFAYHVLFGGEGGRPPLR